MYPGIHPGLGPAGGPPPQTVAAGAPWAPGVVAGGAALSLAAVAYYFWHTLSFEPTSGAAWRQWETVPLAVAGMGGLLLSAGSLAVWAVTRRRRPVAAMVAPAAALVAVVAGLLAAAVVDYNRHHPVAGERGIAASLPVPQAWGPSRYVVVPESPPDIEPGPPRVRRILTAGAAPAEACVVMQRAIRAWGGTLVSDYGPLDSGRMRCFLAGSTPQGWSYDVAVAPGPATGSVVTVEVYPPGG